jgi:enamine deaminase RidA (YjgF/YER057c/UK114 family)
MAVELVRSSRLYDGVPYAYSAIAPPGRLIFTAGACPLDETGAIVSPGDVRAQARRAVVNLRMALAEAGAELTDVVRTTIYVAADDRAELVAAWDEIHGLFGEHEPPSTLLGVALLGWPDQLVEIEAIALRPAAGDA